MISSGYDKLKPHEITSLGQKISIQFGRNTKKHLPDGTESEQRQTDSTEECTLGRVGDGSL